MPADAVLATTRMRVMVKETTNSTLGPCDSFGYGGVKDFGIIVGTGGVDPMPPSYSYDGCWRMYYTNIYQVL